MSRNGSGVYTFPSSPGEFKDAVSGTTVTAASWNTLAADIEAAITASIASDGQTTCSARIPFAAGISGMLGTTSLTSFSATGAANTGFYFPTNAKIGFVISGTEQVRLEDGIFEPVTTNDIDLGTSSLKFKDAYFNGTVNATTFVGALTGTASGNLANVVEDVTPQLGGNLDTNGNAIEFKDSGYTGTLDTATLSAARTWTFPNSSGTIPTTSSTSTLTNKTIASSTNTFTFDDAVNATETALTSTAASIAIDLSASNDFTHTFTENTTLANPTNITVGQSGAIRFTQHASSPKTLAFGSYWDFAGGTAPTVTATNSARDTLFYHVRSTTLIEATMVLNWS